MRNLDLLPPTGSVILCPSLKIEGGSDSPLKVLALISNGAEIKLNSRSKLTGNACSAFFGVSGIW